MYAVPVYGITTSNKIFLLVKYYRIWKGFIYTITNMLISLIQFLYTYEKENECKI